MSSVPIVKVLAIERKPYHALNMADSAFSHAIINKEPINITDSVWVQTCLTTYRAMTECLYLKMEHT